ncbi:MAG: bis(5'-nucleosyl)-tetraphosphatase (symmetrical) YqeK [Spirochaetaceae bacterium]
MVSTPTEFFTRVAVAAARLESELSQAMSQTRLAHVRRVERYAVWLAGRFGEEPERARLAALGHDLAREWPEEQIRSVALTDGLPVSQLEREVPKILHGRAAAVRLFHHFQVCDPEILAAVRNHTLGAPGMSRLEKIIYCADYLEPGRPYIEPAFRRYVEELELDAMICASVEHNNRRGHSPAPRTSAMYRELCGEVGL